MIAVDKKIIYFKIIAFKLKHAIIMTM